MPRNLTDPNYDDTFEWQERVTDADGDSLSISVTIDGTDISSLAWADFTTTTNTINGDETEVLVDFTADRSGMTEGKTYQFEVTADDGLATTTRTFQLEVTEPPPTYDGTKLFTAPDSFTVWNFNTGYDFSTYASQGSSWSLDGSSDIRGLRFKPDGTKAFTVSNGSNNIESYTISPAFDHTSNTLKNTFDISSETDQGSGFSWKSDGKKVFVIGKSQTIAQYSLTNAWDITTASLDKTNSISNPSTPWAIEIVDSGNVLITGGSLGNIYIYNLGTAYDIGNPTQTSAAQPSNDVYGIVVPDNNFLFKSSGSNGHVEKYEFGTLWDATTLNKLQTFTQVGPAGMAWGV